MNTWLMKCRCGLHINNREVRHSIGNFPKKQQQQDRIGVIGCAAQTHWHCRTVWYSSYSRSWYDLVAFSFKALNTAYCCCSLIVCLYTNIVESVLNKSQQKNEVRSIYSIWKESWPGRTEPAAQGSFILYMQLVFLRQVLWVGGLLNNGRPA